jgi:bacterioferritin (cytochrome b1)
LRRKYREHAGQEEKEKEVKEEMTPNLSGVALFRDGYEPNEEVARSTRDAVTDTLKKQRVEDLEEENATLHQKLSEYDGRIKELEEQNAALNERIDELEFFI